METIKSFITNHSLKICSILIILTIYDKIAKQRILKKAKKLNREKRLAEIETIVQKEILEKCKVSLIKLKVKLRETESIKYNEEIKHLSDVIFFEGEIGECTNHVKQNFDCTIDGCPAGKIRKMVSYIDGAQQSLDVCLYMITNDTLGSAIMRASTRGVNVRMVGDGDMAFSSGSQVVKFMKKNISVQLTGPPFIMHEKFVIIDKKILIHGSMNWTSQACSGNIENIVITGISEIVIPFQTHFENMYARLLKQFKESKRASEAINQKLAEARLLKEKEEYWD